MVHTRGNREEDKTTQPPRECRRSNKGFLQEPEDDIIWESDEHSLNKSQGKIKENNNLYINPHQTRRNSCTKLKDDVEDGEKVNRKCKNLNYDVILSQSLRKGSRMRPWRSKRSHCFSCSETKPKVPVPIKDIPNESVNMQDDMEGESESDEEVFVRKKKSCYSSNRLSISRSRRGTIDKEIHLNLDEIEITDEKSDNGNGPRRSLRKREFRKSFRSSWLVDPKMLRGYNHINSSEPENEEPRIARKSNRYNRPAIKETRQQRCTRRFRPSRECRSHYGHSNSSRINERTKQQTHYGQIDEDDEDCKKESNEDTEELTVRRQANKKEMYNSRPRRCRQIKIQSDEDSNGDENVYENRYRYRRRPSSTQHFYATRSGTQLKDEGTTESDNSVKNEKNEEDDEESKEDKNSEKCTKIIKRTGDPIMNDIKNGHSPCEVPNKRMRKPVSRLTYDAAPRHNRKGPQYASSSSSGSSDEDNRQSTSKGRSRYSLRQNRKTLSVKEGFDDIQSHRHKHKNSLASYLNSPARKPVYSRKHKATHDSSSSSDEKAFEKRKAKSMSKARNQCLPINMKPEDMQMVGMRERKAGTSLADIDPMSMDKSITFESIGGLTEHIKSLKEMILFPIMYPEVFQKFGVSPPRGVLFYGPPGTGKTLVARALANECSNDDRKIAFFMRKGADCLSKWVGESERQLRLLFDQAYQMRPSIIFFDEIDGLAPVRSSRQDQIHSSIVSTLLALLDGVDSRGEMVIIGATNRIDAIDPALRRPGRFDREFHFPLPSIEARKKILKIHTNKWDPKPSPALLKYLAEQTVGYCGADLKSLCGESALVALRRKYPQIYSSKQKLMLNVESIQIKCRHFKHCLNKITPAGQRAENAPGRKLDRVTEPLMKNLLNLTLSNLRSTFPQGFQKTVLNRVLHRPRLLLVGEKNQGQTTHLGPAILHALERLPTHKLDFPSLFSNAARAPEEACAQIFHEAKRNVPSILYIPLLDHLWMAANDSVKSTFLYLLNDLEPTMPILMLATVERSIDALNPEIAEMFSIYREELFCMPVPSREERFHFFQPIFHLKAMSKPVPRKKKRVIESLPLAPPPVPRELKPEEMHKIEYVEEASLRELRIFLRQICAKLGKNKMFYIFTKPVDLEEVQDYLQIISQPMDLETMMTKIDLHQYECAQDFLKDIELIVSNALEYNPDRDPEDKIIRHRACTLRDTAYAFIKAEMDTDFEDKCQEIRKNRKTRRRHPSTLPPHFVQICKNGDVNMMQSNKNTEVKTTCLHEDGNGNKTSTPAANSGRKRKIRSSWSRGVLSSKKKKIDKSQARTDDHKEQEENEDGNADSTGRVDECDMEKDKNDSSRSNTIDADNVMINGNLSMEENSHDSNKVTSAFDTFYSQCINESIAEETSRLNANIDINCDSAVSSSEQGGCLSITDTVIDFTRLEKIFDLCLTSTEYTNVEELHYLYSIFSALCKKHQTSADRNQLLNEIEKEIKTFALCRSEVN